MGFIENALHPDRKRRECWQRFSSEAGGFFVSDGESGVMRCTSHSWAARSTLARSSKAAERGTY